MSQPKLWPAILLLTAFAVTGCSRSTSRPTLTPPSRFSVSVEIRPLEAADCYRVDFQVDETDADGGETPVGRGRILVARDEEGTVEIATEDRSEVIRFTTCIRVADGQLTADTHVGLMRDGVALVDFRTQQTVPAGGVNVESAGRSGELRHDGSHSVGGRQVGSGKGVRRI